MWDSRYSLGVENTKHTKFLSQTSDCGTSLPRNQQDDQCAYYIIHSPKTFVDNDFITGIFLSCQQLAASLDTKNLKNQRRFMVSTDLCSIHFII